MDTDVTKAIADLTKRVEYQEKIHSNIDFTAKGFLHGVVTMLPAMLVGAGLTIIAVLIIRANKKSE